MSCALRFLRAASRNLRLGNHKQRRELPYGEATLVHMKADALLVVDPDPSSTELVSHAAMKTGHRLIRANTSREAFRILGAGFSEVDVIVVDVDSGIHGLALLEAVDVCPTSPPVIILTSFEEVYVTPIGAAHGAAACLGKPFTVEKLATIIEQVSAPNWRSAACSSDAWGHPHRCKNSFIACSGCHRKQPERAPTLELTKT